MAPPRSYAIPKGWVMRKKVENDGTEVECFVCLATGLEFGTYNGMMRYVHFAIAREASVYSPDFSPPKKKVISKRRKKKVSSKRGKKKASSKRGKKKASSKQGSNAQKEGGAKKKASSKWGSNAQTEGGALSGEAIRDQI